MKRNRFLFSSYSGKEVGTQRLEFLKGRKLVPFLMQSGSSVIDDGGLFFPSSSSPTLGLPFSGLHSCGGTLMPLCTSPAHSSRIETSLKTRRKKRKKISVAILLFQSLLEMNLVPLPETEKKLSAKDFKIEKMVLSWDTANHCAVLMWRRVKILF